MHFLSSSVGYGINATSVRNTSLSIPGISNTHTCDRGLPVLRPTSLLSTLFKNVPVGRSPLRYISASPSCTSFTALRDASVISFSSIILYSDIFIPRDSPISLILSSSPTRIALAIPRSLATFTASSTAASCATATDRVLVLHSPTLERSSLKFLAILLSPSIMTASPLIHSKNSHMQTHITFYIIPPMGSNVKSRPLG